MGAGDEEEAEDDVMKSGGIEVPREASAKPDAYREEAAAGPKATRPGEAVKKFRCKL